MRLDHVRTRTIGRCDFITLRSLILNQEPRIPYLLKPSAADCLLEFRPMRYVQHFRLLFCTIVALVVAMVLSTASFAAADSPLVMKSGTLKSYVSINGKKRSFRVHVPKNFASGEKVPLIVVLHGAIGTGWTGEWDSRMSEQSEKDKFIVAYPNGYTRTWNAGGCCGPAKRSEIDDIGFVRALIEKLKAEPPIDGDRVFVSGISNGAMMAFRIGRELSDIVAAIAPIQGCMYPSRADLDCPISVVVFHGTRDSIIRYDGGTGSKFGYKVTSQSVPETIKFWVNHNGCKREPIREEKGNIIKDLYTNGKNGTEVCLYTLKGGGHSWPGGRRCVFFGDKPTKELSATEEMCKFFMAHPKKRELAAISEWH